MKKLLLSSIIAMFAVPAFADTVTTLPNNAVCNETNLGTSSGAADIEVVWTPNTINTQWYTGYGANTAAANPTTCTYNGTINLPATNPTRPGYAFNGWKLRAPQCTIPAEDMNTEPTSGSGHGWYNNADVCYNYDGWTINCSTVQDLAVNQWKVAWSNGDVVNGIASCNDTLPSNWDTLMAQQAAIEELPEEEQGAAFEAWYASAMSSLYGTNGSAIMPSNTFTSNSTGQYCWCKATHYTANNAQQCSLLSSAWVLTPEGFFEGEPEKCAKRCPDLCANLSRYSLTLFFGGSITQ